ncbi:MAG TPA: MopE-related protein [Anaeromyxobacter sp.]|nr:MopE-related protein [Anaeromyxobacter sp.]
MVNVVLFVVRSAIMIHSRPRVRRRVLAGLIPLILAGAALPLMAPTCGTLAPGIKTFSRGSIVIPMDVCYQSMSDDLHSDSSGTGYTPFACPQAKATGDAIRAYGLVYQLVRNNVAVYWIINPSKTATTDVDMSIQYGNGPPALLYNWGNGTISTTAPTSASKIDYRGGPFVVDGSDFAKANAILQAYSATFSGVKVHVSNVAFQGYVAKTMAGGWSAGGTVPPKLALLDIGSDGAGNKNAEPVIQGYLTRAGLDTAGASGTATGTHGQIYDKLTMEDFLPAVAGDWTTSNLYKNGYQVLWVPHWAAPSSCSDCTGFTKATCPCTSKYAASTIAAALATIGSFSAAGHDVFAECAGLGSFEGVFANTGTTTSFSGTYNSGGTATHFETSSPTGFWINLWPQISRQDAATDSANLLTGFPSPLMQIGDFPFVATSGAVEDYKPSAFKPGVVEFISDGTHSDYAIFSMLPPSSGRGTIVYLAGHSYSGTDGSFEVSGSRLVLNTLFNLGAACVESGVACNTGQLGECAKGVMSCDSSGSPYCKPVNTPQPEVCDGKDNDCNGLVDDGLTANCYDGPAGTQDVGLCHGGVSTCVQNSDGSYGMSACTGEVLPATEICNGLDDACTGHPDQVLVNGSWVPLSGSCYTGPSSSIDPATGQPRGICKPGIAACSAGAWGACAVCPADAWKNPSAYPNCEILPQAQTCETDSSGSFVDMTCTGVIPSCGCTDGQTQPCYTGPAGTQGVGICQAGTRTCTGGAWGECSGEQTPLPPDCSSATADDNCNGVPDHEEPACNACPASGDPSLVCFGPASCGTYPDGTACKVAWVVEDAPCTDSSTCTGGSTCLQGYCRVSCTSTATCPTGKTCVDDLCRASCNRGDANCEPAGQCRNGTRSCAAGVLGDCSGTVLPTPEICDGKDNNCDGQIDENPDTLCGSGFTCVSGVCVPGSCGVEQPCPGGFYCNGGTCQRGLCGGVLCQPGETCLYGTCVDPCAGVSCGVGATCASGVCTGGGCFLSGCPTGQICQQGYCVADPCAGTSCPVGTFCRAGDCVQSCVWSSCASGQKCSIDGFCEADPCASVSCDPGQICLAGRCQTDPCATVGCGSGQTCVDGVCQDDPCNAVECPVGACSGGQCYPVTQRDTSSAGTNSSSGCGCGTGAASPLTALLFLLLVPLARRRLRPAPGAAPAGGARRSFRGRRGGGAALTVLLAAAALLSQGCGKGSSSVDLSRCKATCGEQQCIDLNYDPAHCGRCDTSCASGQICRDGACGPSSAVAPYIVSVSPSQATHGALAPVPITLTGQRFASGAEVRAISTGGTATYSTTFVDSGHLTASLDLSDVPVTQLELRVVNPDLVISNEAPFDVVALAATLTGVTPSSVNTGTVTPLDVTGSGFTDSSLCHILNSSISETALPSTSDGKGGLTCTLDATGLAPGSYDLWVVNDGTVASNHLTVQVNSQKPVLAALSPSSGEPSAVLDITVVGSGFDVTSTVYFQWGSASAVAVPTTYVDATHLLVSQFTLPSSAQAAKVYVQNGSTASNELDFACVAGLPSITNLSVSPSPLYQGGSVQLTFGGSGLWTGTHSGPTAPAITLLTPAGAPLSAPSVSVTATSAVGTVSLAGQPAGLYSAYLTLSDGSNVFTSPSFPVRVLSNVAVLYSATPGGGKQGTSLPVTLTASNLRGTAANTLVLFTGPGSTALSIPPSSLSGTTVVATLPLTGLDTGVYALAIQNPSAGSSNQVSFTVMPGQPTVTSVTPGCAVQSDTPVTVTVTGTNFALADAQGNQVSQLMYSADGSTWSTVPATVTVTDASHLTAVLDTRSAVAGTTYSIAVWNPPGPMKSNSDRTFTVSGSTCP